MKRRIVLIIVIVSLLVTSSFIYFFFHNIKPITRCNFFKGVDNKSIDCGIVEIDTTKSIYKVVGKVGRVKLAEDDIKFELLTNNELGEKKSIIFTFLFNQLSDKNVAVTKIKGTNFFENRAVWMSKLDSPIKVQYLLKEKKEVVVVIRSYNPTMITLAKKKFSQNRYLSCLTSNIQNFLSVLNTNEKDSQFNYNCPIIVSHIYYVE